MGDKEEHSVPALYEDDVLSQASEIKIRREKEEAILAAAEEIQARRDEDVDQDEVDRAAQAEEDKAEAFRVPEGVVPVVTPKEDEEVVDEEPEPQPEPEVISAYDEEENN